MCSQADIERIESDPLFPNLMEGLCDVDDGMVIVERRQGRLYTIAALDHNKVFASVRNPVEGQAGQGGQAGRRPRRTRRVSKEELASLAVS